MKPEERFNILQSVASDGLGETFQTVKKDGQGLAAVTILKTPLLKSADARAAYEDAVRKLHAGGPARTARPVVLNLQEDNGWIATEWVGHETLADVSKRLDRLEPEAAAGIACGILDALTELHDLGVVHGALDPTKVWLAQGFLPGGVAIAHPSQHLLRGGVPLLQDGKAHESIGKDTASYRAPEQVRGDAVGVSADLYAVGAILHTLLTGKPLFDGSAEEVLNAQLETPAPAAAGVADVPQALSDIVAIALNKDATQRFQAALAMRRAVAHCRQSGDESSEKAAAPLGLQPDQGVGELLVVNAATEEAASDDAAAKEAAAAAAAAEAAKAKDAADKAAAEKDAADKAAAEKDAAEKEAAEKNAAEKEAADKAAAEEAAKEQAEAVKNAEPIEIAASAEVSEDWFAASKDEEAFKKMHGEEEPPPLYEINRKYRRRSYVMIAATILLLLGAFVALYFLIPSDGASNVAETAESRVIDNQPS